MTFDALTILGVFSSILCGGFLVALVKRNGSRAASVKIPARSEDG